PEFVRAYFEELHHPNEELGVDFWWIDWQQGLSCDLPGLDPLWLINHLHFYDLGRDGVRRPFIFSRWGNEGHQRYPIGFSGDTYRTWDSLRFQTYMTPTAANVAYGWWSHDIGGHTGGFEDSELFTRWVQFGALSPINRIHVTKGDFYDNRPWMFEDAEVLRVVREALQFRHALIPYLYTMAHRAHTESLPPILPMYYDYPEHEEAYHCPHQYLFGTELIAAPLIDRADPETQFSRQVVWLPEGDWYHFFTGEHFAGSGWHAVYGRLQDIPLFARAGAIVPLGPTVGWGGVDNPDTLDIHIFAGADNTFTLYEDDGETTAYREDYFCLTTITQEWSDNHMVVEIDTPHAKFNFMPDRRTFNLIIHGVSDSAQVSAEMDGGQQQITSHYDAETETLHLAGFEMDAGTILRVTLQSDELLARRNRKKEKLLRLLHFFSLHTGVRNRIAADIDAILDDPTRLAPYIITMSDSQAQAIFETLYEAGVHVVQDTHKPVTVILWNNHDLADITYRYSDAYLFFGLLKSSNHTNGNLPRFLTFSPPAHAWRHGAYEEHVHPTQWHAQVDYFNLMTVKTGYHEKTP
ncbi:MAG: DUF5110 domain-containing protein, partial [Chloroflexi bacterium]|nr:DUF5110 domain-containing protein [Chloroflexota bacterium]